MKQNEAGDGWFERLFAWVVPTAWRDAADLQTLQAGRAFVGTAVVFLATDLAAGALLAVGWATPAIGVIVLTTAVSLVTLLVAFRYGLPLRPAALLLTGVALAGFLAAITVTGGLQSPLAPWLPAMPLGVLVTQNHRMAWSAFGVIVAAMTGWALAAHLGAYGPILPAAEVHAQEIALQSALAVLTLLAVSTARRQSRAELATQRAAEIRARVMAEAESRAKTHVMASVSHEVRTPMTGILGLADLLSETPLDARQASWVRTIRGTSEALLTVVDDLLDAARLDAGAMPLSDKPFYPARLLDQVAALFAPTAAAKSITLLTTVHADVPERMRGDPARLRQILVNLLGNAIKYTARGEVSVRAWMDDGMLCLGVQDTGPGIPADRVDDVFTPFLQLDPTRDGGQGAGLGLSIVRLLAERMGGRASVQSQVGVGTTFLVKLPLVEATLDDPTDTEVTLSPPRVRLKILVADDNPINQMVVRTMLEGIGHTVVVVNNGQDAIDRLRTFDADLVLMDVQMPGLDGLEATRRLRRDPRFKRLPVLALTATGLPAEHEQCMHAGMNGMVSKPVTRDSLQRSLDALTQELE